MVVIKEFKFDAAHYLPSYKGKCEALHGHTYRLVVKVRGYPDAEGMVMDFAQIKKIVNSKIISKLDHSLLNDTIKNPSAENIAIWCWDRLRKPLEGEKHWLYEVEVWETATSGCVYGGEFFEGEKC